MIGNVGAVFEFEWKRAITFTRLIWWTALAAFPAFIMGLVRYAAIEKVRESTEIWRNLCAWLIFALIPMLVSMLGTLMWATPAISAELERRSWSYLAVRPNGLTAVLLGKYLMAVTWVIPPALIGLTISVVISQTAEGWRTWLSMVFLVLLSAPAYAAVYLLFGVIMPRRAMVLAVAYTLIFELGISFVPAVINKITIQYRLRSLAAEWCKLSFGDGVRADALKLIGSEPAWHHLFALGIIVSIFLAASVAIIKFREFSVASESET